ncbi:acyltransferase family-domain-containing protein [Podospora didyma]|uniref:Acyltransferase family-domain-containing protein n=1 Tax=Podospora didyma TaxID=330526 RepID=A0AAE0P072_9PEZI|nr:acyltransferase family-domain-containing protein [Podospora didyma]
MHSRREGILDGTGADAAAVRARTPDSSLPLGSALPSMGGTLRWLRHLVWPKGNSDGSQRQLRSTAYLDGLRGFAAFLVYIHHHELWTHVATNAAGTNDYKIFESGFGQDGIFRFATFPGIRNFFTGGHMAVAVFYVISGYVLSAKSLSLIHANEQLKLSEVLASSFFRRWFRLYLPLIVTTLVWVTSWHVFGVWVQNIHPKGTLGEELWNWYREFKSFSFLFRDGGDVWVSYNTHLWSIPLEMKGSIIIFAALASLSRATTKARLLCEAFLVYYFMYIVDGYYLALFMSGMLQCDLDLLARRSTADGGITYFPRFLRRLEPFKTFIFYHLFVIGILLAGVPTHTDKVEDLREAPGWYYLSYLKPSAVYDSKWFYLSVAANMIMACVPRIHWLRAFFESRFCQFLGRVSFALYLVHGPILGSVGDRVYHAVGWVRALGDGSKELAPWINILPLSRFGPMGLEIAFVIPQMILLPLTLWVADLTTRIVDEPSVRFASWLYKRTLGGAAPLEPKPEDSLPLMRLA